MTSLSLAERTAQRVRAAWPQLPRAAVILGTGLGGLAEHIAVEATFPYQDFHGFATPTAMAHHGRLVCGQLASVPIIAMQGRVHYYEGVDFDHITLPVRVAAALGCEVLIASNASGGLNPQYRSGDIMVLDDHIDLMGKRNARGRTPPGGDRSGKRPDYDAALAEVALETGRRENFCCHRGVYVAVTGPNYETRAEYRFMRRIGGDAVGMSTVPEVIAARHDGLRVLAISVVTNVANPDAPDLVDALEVVDLAEHAEPRLRSMITDVLRSLASAA